MKAFIQKLNILIVVFFTTISIQAQEFQGQAFYTSKTDVDTSTFSRPDMSEEQKKRMEERLKGMSEKKYILTFNRTESIYKVEEQLENPGQGRGGGRFGAIMSGAMDGTKYKNVKKNLALSENELFGKLFLIKGELPKLEWKMTGETKQIGAYMCFKATAIKTWDEVSMASIGGGPRPGGPSADDEAPKEAAPEPKDVEITAWYTMQIPVNLGPGEYWGLPGLILEVYVGKTTILCTKIVLNPEEKVTIKEPTKGKEVTNEEYVEIATEKFQEMRENFRARGGRQGGGGRR